MDSKILSVVCTQIYRRFPEIDGIRPKVQTQALPDQKGQNYLLVFRGAGVTSDGKSLPRIVRATVDDKGKILKVTTSR